MDNYSTFDELDEYLYKQGYSRTEIRQIIGKLEDYEKTTVHDSIFDSLENGTFSLETIIREAIDSPDKAATSEDR